jgi:hypothetical protein
MNKYSKKRAIAQQRTSSFKYIDVPAGTVLNFNDVIENSIQRDGQEVITDYIMCSDKDGRNIKLPVREFLKMQLPEGASHYEGENGNDEVSLPAGITIVSSKDRVDTDGDTVFPVHAYNGADEFLAEDSDMDWADLKATKLKEDNNLKAVQDYVVELN